VRTSSLLRALARRVSTRLGGPAAFILVTLAVPGLAAVWLVGSRNPVGPMGVPITGTFLAMPPAAAAGQ